MVIFSENPRISFPVNMSPKVNIILPLSEGPHCTGFLVTIIMNSQLRWEIVVTGFSNVGP